MIRIVDCVSYQHNPWLLALAAVVCLISTSTALRLMMYGAKARGGSQSSLLLLGGACGGGGAWVTHFIAMLAFNPGVATGYDPAETIASLVIIIFAGALSVLATFRTPKPWNIWIWGLFFSFGVGAMHYADMAVLRVPGRMSWNPGYVVASLAAGGFFAMLSLRLAIKVRSGVMFLASSATMALAICSLHLIGMAAVTITLDPTVQVSPNIVPTGLVAVGVGALVILIAAIGLATGWADVRTQRSSLELLRQIIEGVPQGLAYFDADDRYVMGNKAYHREITAVGFEIKPGMRYREILDCAMAAHKGKIPLEAQAAWVTGHLRERAGASSQFDQQKSDGRFVRVESNRTLSGGVVMLVSDITGLRRQADDLAIARDLSEAATRAKSSFLATMSHEIRTPLNGVLGMAQAMAFDDLSPVQSERLDVIRSSGEALLAILNDVLDISKIEAGKLELEDTPFELGAIVMGAHAVFTTLAHNAGLIFALDLTERAEGRYRGDPTRIRQVLYNLISNAIKFTPKGEVRVAVDFHDGELLMTVSDTGIGMSTAEAAGLFQKFVQADASTTRRFGGTGLGLAICSELVDLMGGALTVDSAPGRGSVFKVAAPLTRLADDQQRSAAPEQEEPATFDIRVLAAEDNPTNRLVLKTLLAQAGIEPVIVENGAEAVEAWSTGSWDLILMDVQMPVMDGPEATRTIRRREQAEGRPRTPIIALTANAMAHHVKDYIAVGMDAHVAKPIETAQLFAAMESVLDSAADAIDAADTLAA